MRQLTKVIGWGIWVLFREQLDSRFVLAVRAGVPKARAGAAEGIAREEIEREATAREATAREETA